MGRKYFAFTFFDPSHNQTKIQEAAALISETFYPNLCNQIVINFEICPTTKHPHLQGYLGFYKDTGYKYIHAIIETQCKLSRLNYLKYTTKGDCYKTYCLKDDGTNFADPIRLGTWQEDSGGNRTDIDIVRECIKRNTPLEELFENDVMFKHCSAFLKYRGLKMPKRTTMPEIRIYWGPTGSGKSRAVYDEFGYDGVFSRFSSKWADGYEQQPCYLIDDFNGQTHDITYWLRFCDRYPLTMQVKNGIVQLNSPYIIFTSNIDPDVWFLDSADSHRKAFFRRVKEIKYFA